MGIALIIVGGLVLMTLFASGFDYLTKRRKRVDDETKARVVELEGKLAALENQLHDSNERIGQLEGDLSFMNKLIEDKSK